MCATLIKIADQAALVAGSESIQEIVGFRSTASLASVMLAVLAFDLTIVVVLIAMRSQESQQRVFLAQTRLPPELTLAVGSEWHAFLSHLWATGQGTLEQATRPPLRTCVRTCLRSCAPASTLAASHRSDITHMRAAADQAAVIKRQLQTLLPGIHTFLDGDQETCSRPQDLAPHHHIAACTQPRPAPCARGRVAPARIALALQSTTSMIYGSSKLTCTVRSASSSSSHRHAHAPQITHVGPLPSRRSMCLARPVQ
jgi:hypothetical protein